MAVRGGACSKRYLVGAAIALALACPALALSGCAGSGGAQEALTDGIERDMEQLTSLTSDEAADLFASDYTTDLQNAGVDPASVYGPLFSDLVYSVDSVEVDGDRATVGLTVTNKDLTTALQNYTATVTNELTTQAGRDALATLSDADLTRHLADVLVQCVEDASLGDVSTSVELTYVRSGGSWELEDDAELVSALLGGLDPAVAGEATDGQLAATADAASANVASVGSGTSADASTDAAAADPAAATDPTAAAADPAASQPAA